ncbi:MAG: outer membrane lipoprotein-sorting protein [Candidatus Saccharicenans sp.]|nr:outer membrane lipoprotein-sorting protein [Candidatus Saccharicenans sp.]
MMIVSLSADLRDSGASAELTVQQVRTPSGQEILKRVDDNITAGNKIMTAKMIIHLRRTTRTVEFKSYIQGTEKAFTEYLAPAREKGTRMLKLGDQLWMYSPWTERTILISGHMLRQSVMGSDLSYEDMMEDPRLSNSYTADVVGEEKVRLEAQGGDEVLCWVLELSARQEDVAYPRRKLWVDKERYVVLREELYARGGTLLKKVEVLSLRKFEARWVPDRAIFKDVLKAGEGTEFVIESLEFDAKIPDHIFSRASLK